MNNLQKLILISPITTSVSLIAYKNTQDYLNNKTDNKIINEIVSVGTLITSNVLMNYKIYNIISKIKK